MRSCRSYRAQFLFCVGHCRMAPARARGNLPMRLLLPALACALFVSGCSVKPNQPEASADDDGDSAPAAAAAPSPSAEPAVARKESVSNDLYEFEYSYPVEAAAIPDLRKWLDDDLEKQRRELIEN